MFEEVTKKERAESALLRHTGRQHLKWTVTLRATRVELGFLCLNAWHFSHIWHQFKLNIHNHCRDLNFGGQRFKLRAFSYIF